MNKGCLNFPEDLILEPNRESFLNSEFTFQQIRIIQYVMKKIQNTVGIDFQFDTREVVNLKYKITDFSSNLDDYLPIICECLMEFRKRILNIKFYRITRFIIENVISKVVLPANHEIHYLDNEFLSWIDQKVEKYINDLQDVA